MSIIDAGCSSIYSFIPTEFFFKAAFVKEIGVTDLELAVFFSSIWSMSSSVVKFCYFAD
jgi:hypothetical protein